jgi:hypothetical protein
MDSIQLPRRAHLRAWIAHLFGIVIHESNGKDFAPKTSLENRYVQAVFPDGVPMTGREIAHSDMVGGSILTFDMGPNPKLGTSQDDHANWSSQPLFPRQPKSPIDGGPVSLGTFHDDWKKEWQKNRISFDAEPQ